MLAGRERLYIIIGPARKLKLRVLHTSLHNTYNIQGFLGSNLIRSCEVFGPVFPCFHTTSTCFLG